MALVPLSSAERPEAPPDVLAQVTEKARPKGSGHEAIAESPIFPEIEFCRLLINGNKEYNVYAVNELPIAILAFYNHKF